MEISASRERPSCARRCRRVTVGIAVFLFSICTLFSVVAFAYSLIAVFPCDLSCTEDTPGAVNEGEGYYECDGREGCGPARRFFYFFLTTTCMFFFLWIVVIAVCCWRRSRRETAKQAADNAPVATDMPQEPRLLPQAATAMPVAAIASQPTAIA